MLRVVLLDILGTRLRQRGRKLLDIGAREDLALRRFKGLHRPRVSIEPLLDGLLPGDFLVDQPLEDLPFGGITLLRLQALAGEDVIDLMESYLMAIDLRRHLRCWLL